MRDWIEHVITSAVCAAIMSVAAMLAIWFIQWEVTEPKWSTLRVAFAVAFGWTLFSCRPKKQSSVSERKDDV